MPKEKAFKARMIRRGDDLLIVEAPNGLGDGEKKLLRYYREVGPRPWIVIIKGRTPTTAPTYEGPHAWGDDTW